MNDYTELKRLAEAATLGPWQAYDTHGKRFVESMHAEAHVVCDTPRKQWLKDSVFIAAANPAAVLALIAENAALRSDIETWKLSIRAERDCHRAEKEALQQELGRLKGEHP